jgi:hypothetical protein
MTENASHETCTNLRPEFKPGYRAGDFAERVDRSVMLGDIMFATRKGGAVEKLSSHSKKDRDFETLSPRKLHLHLSELMGDFADKAGTNSGARESGNYLGT